MCFRITLRNPEHYFGVYIDAENFDVNMYTGKKVFRIVQDSEDRQTIRGTYQLNHIYEFELVDNFYKVKASVCEQPVIITLPVDGIDSKQAVFVTNRILGYHVSPVNIEPIDQNSIYWNVIQSDIHFYLDDVIDCDGESISVSTFYVDAKSELGRIISTGKGK